MNYQRLRKEIDLSFSIAQTYLNYKRGDISFDAFVMDAMELSGGSSLIEQVNPKHYRDFIEGLRSNNLPHSSSGSSLTALLEYEGLFDAVMRSEAGDMNNYANSTLTEDEINEMWDLGRDYLKGEQGNLVY